VLPFRRHPNLVSGFIWRKNIEEIKNEIAPGRLSHTLSLFDEDDEGYRSVAACHVLHSDPNQVLGALGAGRPTQQVTGSFCIHVYALKGDCEENKSRQEALDAIVDPDNGRTEGFAGFDDSGYSGTDYYRGV
jgi:hypothetical protein